MMTGHRWKVAEAKARLSEMLGAAKLAPQIIENRGREVAVVLGIEDFRRLRSVEEAAAPAGRMADFLQYSAKVRGEGGGQLRLPRRKPRQSPFSDQGA